MALSATAARVGVFGRLWYAPQGTAVPTATSGALTSFLEVGYITEDGVTLSVDTQSADLRAWQNGDLLRRVQQSVTWQVQFAMAETNEHSLKLYYNNYTHGAGVTDGSVELNGDQPYRGAFVLDVVDDTNLIRLTMADAQVSDRGDIPITSGDLISYDVTLAAFPDANGNSGNLYVATSLAS